MGIVSMKFKKINSYLFKVPILSSGCFRGIVGFSLKREKALMNFERIF